MSINSLTNAAAARRPDTFPFNDVPKNVGEIADAANRPPTAAAPTNIGAIANQKNAVETAQMFSSDTSLLKLSPCT